MSDQNPESFMGIFKAELMQDGSFMNQADAKLEIAEFIKYYNTQRRHSSLAYLTSFQFEENLIKAA